MKIQLHLAIKLHHFSEVKLTGFQHRKVVDISAVNNLKQLGLNLARLNPLVPIRFIGIHLFKVTSHIYFCFILKFYFGILFVENLQLFGYLLMLRTAKTHQTIGYQLCPYDNV